MGPPPIPERTPEMLSPRSGQGKPLPVPPVRVGGDGMVSPRRAQAPVHQPNDGLVSPRRPQMMAPQPVPQHLAHPHEIAHQPAPEPTNPSGVHYRICFLASLSLLRFRLMLSSLQPTLRLLFLLGIKSPRLPALVLPYPLSISVCGSAIF